ncbi:50S ribosomal protein L11 methyltransferase [Methyloferula stellata]|uniref:50S ribosomal protein L11 methyltransferase n=1 Tax=Methyloferula stellata TaxID=876270 RepID=UPI0003712C6D
MLEGLPPNKAAHVMRLECDEGIARRIADIIVETYDPAETAASAFEAVTNTKDWKEVPWIVEVYFGHPPDEDGIRALVECAAGPAAAAAAVFARIDQKDWVAASLEGLVPVRAGRFLVHGAHDRAALRENDIGLEIEAALAFGTGHHGSTRGCLLMLDRVAKRRKPLAILDLGTGSGVLAIAAARLFHRRVQASDIDSVSVAAAASNARLNGAAAYVRPVHAAGLAHPKLAAGAPYDLVFANILARPLRRMAAAVVQHMASGGEIILSGLLARDVPGVISAYGAQGLRLSHRLEIEGWVTLLMQRPHALADDED